MRSCSAASAARPSSTSTEAGHRSVPRKGGLGAGLRGRGVELELAAPGGVRIGGCRPFLAACGQRERDRLQARRLRAAELFAAGVRQAEVARQLGVSAQAVSSWHRCWQTGGMQALRSRGLSDPAPRLSDAQLAAVERALLEGATANGFTGELWTLDASRG